MERPPPDLHEAALRLIASIEANLEVLRASGTGTELTTELEGVLTAIRAELGEPEAFVARQPKAQA